MLLPPIKITKARYLFLLLIFYQLTLKFIYIVLNQLLKIYGHHTAKRFEKELTHKMLGKLETGETYVDHDFE